MSQVQRSSDVVEGHSEKALSYASGGAVALILSFLLFYYRGSTGMFVPLAGVFLLIALGAIGYGGYCALQIRKVTTFPVECPICHKMNRLLAEPSRDFTCSECHRLVPVQDGKVMDVQQVRCGYCNELNYFSNKTDCLLCEACNHEIPISHEDGYVPRKQIASAYAVTEDTRQYELILVAHGPKTEELVGTLQHMLALNRNQVKQMLTELPVTLLTGIPKQKAEMLRAQLSVHEGLADARPLD